jgi:protein-disulfide isomerase
MNPKMPATRFYSLLWLTLFSICANAADPTPSPTPNRRNSGSSAAQGAKPPLPAPASAPATLSLDASRAMGSASAPLFLVEFADYECPYCRQFHVQTLPRLKSAYIDTGVVRYFYKDFPLPTHPEAAPAAVAAHCAGLQGHYWTAQKLLYEQQAKLGDGLYRALGRQLHLDMPRFEACRMGSTARRTIDHDYAEGRRIGVDGTPTFVIGRIDNGRVVIEGVMKGGDYDAFVKEIERLRPKP